MKTTPTIFETIPKLVDPPITGRIHTALRKIREDLYQNGTLPPVSLVTKNHVGTPIHFHESNGALTVNESSIESNFNKNLLRGAVVVGDKDITREPISTLVSEVATKRPRKLGRWD